MSDSVSSSLVLIGMPGAGKSTIGEALALQSGLTFVDTDRLIEQREGRSLQAILDEEGYQQLRRIEAEVLQSSDFSNKVVATGGSAVYSSAAMTHLRQFGPCIFIDIPLLEIVRRVQNFAERGIADPCRSRFTGCLRRAPASLSPLCGYYRRWQWFRRDGAVGEGAGFNCGLQ